MKLVFAYNADSGIVNGLRDLAHKTFSPDTYACNLCAVTYSPLGMKREWRDFIRGLNVEVVFAHRDELPAACAGEAAALPAVFLVEHGCAREWITTAELNAVHTVADLKRLVQRRLCAHLDGGC